MPLPLAMMIPFMGIQSMVMAKQFGENFQYGKRRISAMSNDDFNKLTPAKLLSNANDELRSQIPLMKQSMEDMREFQTFIVKEFLLTIRSIIDAGLGKLIGLTPTEINQTVQNIEHFLHGHFEGHEVTEPSPTETIIPPTETGVLSLSASEITASNDLVLHNWIKNINDYDVTTQNLLLAEKARRLRTEEPIIEQPTEEQQTTKLHPDFIATLELQDFSTGGHRTRSTQWGIMKWFVPSKLILASGGLLARSNWTLSGWQQASSKPDQTLAMADAEANVIKRQLGANYIVNFSIGNAEYYFFVLDDF